jgi:hypothetical protein
VTYSPLRLCSNRAAYEAIPNPRLRLDLARLGERLHAQGVPVIDARVMLIAGAKQEITIARDGRVLIRSPTLSEAAVAFDRVMAWIDAVHDVRTGGPRTARPG